MLTFITDETSVQGKDGQLYGLSIYGGLVLNESDFKELSDFIYKLKDNYVLPQELDLKWRFESVWENMRKIGHIPKAFTRKTHPELYNSLKEDFNVLKGKILDKVSTTHAKIIIVIRPNKLLNASNEQMVTYSIQSLVRKFEKILERERANGIILADELPERLTKNEVIDYSYILKLSRNASDQLISIIPTIDSCISPLHQINDIVLGAMQYYMLEFIRKLNGNQITDTAKNLLAKIVDNFYKSSTGGYVINSGILLYPPKNSRKNTTAGVFLNQLEKELENDFNIH